MPVELLGDGFVAGEEREEDLSGVYGDSFVGRGGRKGGRGGRKGGQGGQGGGQKRGWGGRKGGKGGQQSAPTVAPATVDAAVSKYISELGLSQKTSITKEEFKTLRTKLRTELGKGRLGIFSALQRAGIKVE